MNQDCLKLTAYFGERQRAGDKFLADAVLDLYGDKQVSASIMLRGIAGFGLRHHMRTDQSLSLSEDPPVAVVAVDTAAVINGLIDPLVSMKKRGVLTLERAILLQDDVSAAALPENLHGTVKLSIYVGRKERVFGVPAYIAVCDLLYRRRIAGASVFLGVDGTTQGRRTRAHFFDRNVDVPMMIVAVGSGDQITRILPELGGLLRTPVVTIERVQICKRDGQLWERPHALPCTDEHGFAIWQKLMIYTSEAALHDGQPIHRAIIRRLRERRTSHGATVLRGVWGFHGDHEPHGDKFFQLARRVPAVTSVIDTPENIAMSFDLIDEVTQEQGLVTSEMVPAQVTLNGHQRRGGTDLANHWY